MYTKRAFMSVWSVFGGAIVACTFFAGDVAAKDVKADYQVSAHGLNLRQPAGAREFYARIQLAANSVHEWQPGRPAALPRPKEFYETALGDAIRSANVPLLTQV